MTTTIPRRPGPRAWLQLVQCEAKMVVRDTSGLVVPILLPVLILVMNAMGIDDPTRGEGRAAMSHLMPVVVTMMLAVIGVVNMPSFLALYRTSGVLRRLGVTPASPVLVLGAQVVVSVLQAVLGIAVALGVALLVFDLQLPDRPGVVLGVGLLTAAAMYAVGTVVAAVAPTPNASVAMGLVTFFAFGALGGMFGPVDNLPETARQVGEALPFGAAVEAMSAAWSGASVEPGHLLALVVAAVAGTTLAALLFRWDR